MTNSSKVIGEGTYGCVHNPQMLCKNQKSNKNKVSKLMKDSVAITEFDEYNLVERVDPESNYYLGKPYLCELEENKYNKLSAKKCKNLNKNDPDLIKNLKDYVLMIMENGGENLDDFSEKISSKPVTNKTKKDMELFWIEAHRMLVGVKAFLENDIIHHDLKAQNMVYNNNKKRINFIDFGLMRKKENIINNSKDSKYKFSIFHWSFPLEMAFLNKTDYKETSSKKYEAVKKFLEDIKNDPKSKISKAYSTFLYFISNNTSQFLNYGDLLNKSLKEFSDTITTQLIDTDEEYNKFMNKCIDTIDSFGVGLGFLNVLKNTYKHIDRVFANDLASLFLNMVSYNLQNRMNINDAINNYEELLETHGILKKYKKYFDNHELKNKKSSSLKLDKMIKSIKPNLPSKKDIKNIKQNPDLLDPVPICSPDKELNPITRRCVKKCKPGESRNENFHCRKNKTMKIPKVKPIKEKKTSCPSNKDLNPNTGRCVNKCKSGESRNEKFQCKKNNTKKIPKVKPIKEKKTSCPSNKDINPKTGRCVNKCKPGESRNENFHCRKNKTRKNSSLKYFTPRSPKQPPPRIRLHTY